MVVELMDIGIKMRKVVIFTIRGCFRSICHHPFLVGNICFLILLYRSFPLIFSLLLSVSPVLICTAILLGTLLSYGQPNIPEIESDETTTYESVSIKTGFSRDATVVEQNESYYVERYSDNEKRDGKNEPSLSESRRNVEVFREFSSNDDAPLVEMKSKEDESRDGGIWENKMDERKKKNEWNEERFSDGEIVENKYAPIKNLNDENAESDDEKSVADSFDSETVNVDSLNSPHSPWKHVGNEDGDEEEEENSNDDNIESDWGSDGAESSSPDASMADILPMLDELHPLLDEDNANTVQISRNGSDIASEESSRPSTSSRDSVGDVTEHREDFEVEDDDNEDEGDKEEQAKSAITWTEEDQKNLLDLGSSEIERNQRLENLILRRTRKNMSMVPEINLIDLESSDFPPHVAPISTARQNPFDLPHDPYDNIPGSAPSILLQRRNPFEISFDSNQERPNPMGDGLTEESATLQSREPFFKRHESFNVGPSIFGPHRQDVKMKPFFVPERTIPEESSYSPFHRQPSELSDSKVSSIPETESIGSVGDLEDQKLPEEDHSPHEPEVISRNGETSEEGPPEDEEPISKEESSEADIINEPQLISEMNHVSDIGHGSQSSDEEEELSELDHVDKSDIEFNDSCSEAFKESYSRGSSSSSMSQASEKLFTEINGEGSSILDGKTNGSAEGPDILTQTSVRSGDLNIMSTSADEVPHKEPVYDSSPPSIRKNLSNSSISSDVHGESNLSLPPVVVKRTVSFIERESENREIEKVIPSDSEISGPSVFHRADEHVGVRENDDVKSKSCVEASDDKRLGPSEEEKRLVVDKGEMVTSPNSDADYQEANERLMSTPSAGGSTSHFYDIAMHEPNFEHLDEVPVPNTPVGSHEKVRTIQNLNIPEIYELDCDSSPSIDSQFSPDFISMPSSAGSHVDMHTIHEEADEIKEIDEGLLSELDSVGDFSVTQWGSGSNEFEKHIDTIGESSSLENRAETSATIDVEVINSDHEVNEIEQTMSSENLRDEIEVNSDHEVNETEHTMNLANSRDEIDVYEEDMKCIPESNTAENVDLSSNREFNEINGQDSSVQLNHDYQENNYSPEKNESTSEETEVMVESADEVSHGDRVYTNTPSEMPELEARMREDIDELFKHFGDKEIEKPARSVSNHDYQENNFEDVDCLPEKAESASGMPEVVARTREDIDELFNHFGDKEIEKPANSVSNRDYQEKISEDVDSLPEKDESASGMAEVEARTREDIDELFKHFGDKEIDKPANSVSNRDYQENISEDVDSLPEKDASASGMPEVEARTREDIDDLYKQFSDKEIEKLANSNRDYQENISEGIHSLPEKDKSASGMAEVEARTREDIDVLFKHFGDKEIEKPANSASNHDYQENSSEGVDSLPEKDESASGMPEVEARTREDIDDLYKQFGDKEIKKPVISEPSQVELVIAETIADHSEQEKLHVNTSTVNPTHETPVLEDRSIEEATLDFDRVNFAEIQGTSELRVAEIIPKEGTSFHSNGNSSKDFKPNTDDGSVEVEAEKIDSSSGEELSVKEASSIAAKKADDEVKKPEDLNSTASVKEGKGKKFKGSSSSSSSSSESSSSESDRE